MTKIKSLNLHILIFTLSIFFSGCSNKIDLEPKIQKPINSKIIWDGNSRYYLSHKISFINDRLWINTSEQCNTLTIKINNFHINNFDEPRKWEYKQNKKFSGGCIHDAKELTFDNFVALLYNSKLQQLAYKNTKIDEKIKQKIYLDSIKTSLMLKYKKPRIEYYTYDKNKKTMLLYIGYPHEKKNVGYTMYAWIKDIKYTNNEIHVYLGRKSCQSYSIFPGPDRCDLNLDKYSNIRLNNKKPKFIILNGSKFETTKGTKIRFMRGEAKLIFNKPNINEKLNLSLGRNIISTLNINTPFFNNPIVISMSNEEFNNIEPFINKNSFDPIIEVGILNTKYNFKLANIKLIKEKIYWNNALSSNSVIAFQEYLNNYPNGNFNNEASIAIDKLTFLNNYLNILNSNSAFKIGNFIKKYQYLNDNSIVYKIKNLKTKLIEIKINNFRNKNQFSDYMKAYYLSKSSVDLKGMKKTYKNNNEKMEYLKLNEYHVINQNAQSREKYFVFSKPKKNLKGSDQMDNTYLGNALIQDFIEAGQGKPVGQFGENIMKALFPTSSSYANVKFDTTLFSKAKYGKYRVKVKFTLEYETTTKVQVIGIHRTTRSYPKYFATAEYTLYPKGKNTQKLNFGKIELSSAVSSFGAFASGNSISKLEDFKYEIINIQPID